MRAALWWVLGISVLSLLIVGALGFLALLLAFNGVSEARATPFIVAYFVLLIAICGFAFWAGRRIFHKLTQRADRSLWISVPLTILLTALSGAALLAVGFFALVMFGTG